MIDASLLPARAAAVAKPPSMPATSASRFTTSATDWLVSCFSPMDHGLAEIDDRIRNGVSLRVVGLLLND
jgi:hypothetical protein